MAVNGKILLDVKLDEAQATLTRAWNMGGVSELILTYISYLYTHKGTSQISIQEKQQTSEIGNKLNCNNCKIINSNKNHKHKIKKGRSGGKGRCSDLAEKLIARRHFLIH